MKFEKLPVVIPTGNRSKLSISAVKSVLNQNNCNFELIVSDNSTGEIELSTLQSFCSDLADSRVKYSKPKNPESENLNRI